MRPTKLTKAIKQLSAGILIFTSLFFAGCTTSPDYNNEAAPVIDGSVSDTTGTELESTYSSSDDENIAGADSVYKQAVSPVALAFLEDADKYTIAGDSARAVASLERGLYLEPKNPWLWNRLASERLKQKMWNKAITLAKKSNAFAAGHNQLQKDNWQMIAKARLALGDKKGARKAQEMVRHFSREKT